MSIVMDMITAKNKEKMAQKKAEQEGKAALPKEEKSNAQLQRPKAMVSAIQPVRKGENDVLFKSIRPNFAFFLSGSRVQFKQGFYCTDDPDVIKYIKDNYVGSFVQILEEGNPLTKKQEEEKKEVSAILPNGEE